MVAGPLKKRTFFAASLSQEKEGKEGRNSLVEGLWEKQRGREREEFICYLKRSVIGYLRDRHTKIN